LDEGNVKEIREKARQRTLLQKGGQSIGDIKEGSEEAALLTSKSEVIISGEPVHEEP